MSESGTPEALRSLLAGRTRDELREALAIIKTGRYHKVVELETRVAELEAALRALSDWLRDDGGNMSALEQITAAIEGAIGAHMRIYSPEMRGEPRCTCGWVREPGAVTGPRTYRAHAAAAVLDALGITEPDDAYCYECHRGVPHENGPVFSFGVLSETEGT